MGKVEHSWRTLPGSCLGHQCCACVWAFHMSAKSQFEWLRLLNAMNAYGKCTGNEAEDIDSQSKLISQAWLVSASLQNKRKSDPTPLLSTSPLVSATSKGMSHPWEYHGILKPLDGFTFLPRAYIKRVPPPTHMSTHTQYVNDPHREVQ